MLLVDGLFCGSKGDTLSVSDHQVTDGVSNSYLLNVHACDAIAKGTAPFMNRTELQKVDAGHEYPVRRYKSGRAAIRMISFRYCVNLEQNHFQQFTKEEQLSFPPVLPSVLSYNKT